MKTAVRLSLVALLLAGLAAPASAVPASAAPASAAPASVPVNQDDSPAKFRRAKMYPGWCLINQAVCYEPWGKAWRNW